jgi:hypothetical protein
MRNLIDIKWVSQYKLDHWIGLHFWIWNQASQEGIILWLYMYMMSWLERFWLLGSHMKIQINAKIQVWRIKLNSSGFIHHSHSRNFPTTTTNIWQIARAHSHLINILHDIMVVNISYHKFYFLQNLFVP